MYITYHTGIRLRHDIPHKEYLQLGISEGVQCQIDKQPRYHLQSSALPFIKTFRFDDTQPTKLILSISSVLSYEIFFPNHYLDEMDRDPHKNNSNIHLSERFAFKALMPEQPWLTFFR